MGCIKDFHFFIISFGLFNLLVFVDACNRSTHSHCSGNARCNHYCKRAAEKQKWIKDRVEMRKKGKLTQGPCTFDFFDSNRDGLITLQEFTDQIGSNQVTKRLYSDVKSQSGFTVLSVDGGVTRTEFEALARKILEQCEAWFK